MKTCPITDWVQGVKLKSFSSGERQTSFDCRMLWRGIHKVPTMVSQINPLFHISTVRPRSKRLISLDRRRTNKKGKWIYFSNLPSILCHLITILHFIWKYLTLKIKFLHKRTYGWLKNLDNKDQIMIFHRTTRNRENALTGGTSFTIYRQMLNTQNIFLGCFSVPNIRHVSVGETRRESNIKHLQDSRTQRPGGRKTEEWRREGWRQWRRRWYYMPAGGEWEL